MERRGVQYYMSMEHSKHYLLPACRYIKSESASALVVGAVALASLPPFLVTCDMSCLSVVDCSDTREGLLAVPRVVARVLPPHPRRLQTAVVGPGRAAAQLVPPEGGQFRLLNLVPGPHGLLLLQAHRSL